ncbi:MAG: LuxR C-terminal-related transcriptional regulator [Spirochaetota bacterium]
MNLLELISAFFGILALLLGIYILYLDPKKLIHRLFFLMMMLLACWHFINVGEIYFRDKETFVFWYKMGCIALVFVPMTLHIVMLIVKLSRKIMVPLLAVFYSSHVFFLYQNFNLNLMYNDFVRIDGYWNYIRIEAGFIPVVYMATYALIFIITMILLINWHRKTNFLREKKQSFVLLFSLVLIFIFTFVDYVVFRFFTNRDLGIFAHYIFIWPAGIGISIIRYRFLSVSPGLYSHDIFENIDESVLVLDHNKDVVFANSGAKKAIFGNAAEYKFIQGFGSVAEVADELLKGPVNSCAENIVGVYKDKTKSAFLVKFSVIKDKYNDRTGVLIIAQQLKGIKEFTAEYNITDRELDVIKHAANGLSSREIAEKLNISERTIESHLVNIYNKLEIKKRVELINIFKRYILQK